MAMARREDEERKVLRGPRTPCWGCGKCGCDGNWASRVECRSCHKAAPARIVNEAKRQHRLAEEAAKGSKGGAGGGKAAGAAAKELEEMRKAVKGLKEELRALRGGPAADGDGEDAMEEDGDGGGKIALADLVAIQQLAAKHLPKGDPVVLSLGERLAQARKARDESKTVGQRLRDGVAKAAKASRAVEAAEREEQEAKARWEEAKKAAAAAREHKAGCDQLVVALQGETMRESAPTAPVAPHLMVLQQRFQGHKEAEAALGVLQALAAEQARTGGSVEGGGHGAIGEPGGSQEEYDALFADDSDGEMETAEEAGATGGEAAALRKKVQAKLKKGVESGRLKVVGKVKAKQSCG